MRQVLAVVMIAAMFAPSMAWAISYPRSVKIDGRDCIEDKTSSGGVVAKCMVDGLWRVVDPANPTQPIEPAVARTEPDAPRRLQLSPDLARLELRAYQTGRVTPRYISYEAADALANASLKYAWASAFKWTAISAALAAVLYLPLGSGETDDRLSVSGLTLGFGALFGLAPALALDASARRDVMRASGITARERDFITAAVRRAAAEADDDEDWDDDDE